MRINGYPEENTPLPPDSDDERDVLAATIARAFMKHSGDYAYTVDESTKPWDALCVFLETDVDLLFYNEVVIACKAWNYDGTYFFVVDRKKSELILLSTDSEQLIVGEEDKLQIFVKP